MVTWNVEKTELGEHWNDPAYQETRDLLFTRDEWGIFPLFAFGVWAYSEAAQKAKASGRKFDCNVNITTELINEFFTKEEKGLPVIELYPTIDPEQLGKYREALQTVIGGWFC